MPGVRLTMSHDGLWSSQRQRRHNSQKYNTRIHGHNT